MPVEPERAQHQPDAGTTPKEKNQEALLDTFPASDPVTPRTESGARAVPVGEMLAEGEAKPEVPAGAVPYTFAFADKEKAKLALEKVIRDLPLDRRYATLEGDEGKATLHVFAQAADRDRLAEMVDRSGGEKG